VHSYAAAESVSAPSVEADSISGVHVAGVTAEYTKKGSVVSVRTMLDAHPEFALVHSMALVDYAGRGGDPRRIPSVTAAEGYYYALGAVVAPTVELAVNGWTLGAQARFESYWGIEGLDRHQEQIHDQVATQDRRTLGRLYLAYAPIDALVTRMTLERRGRDGEVADVASNRTEWALSTTVGVRF
jgi:hypothetical protein